MFKSVLVANRGEIACRVFRTARHMGIRTIAVYSEADADALHVREADEAVLIGPAPARESYLDPAKVLAAAKATGAEAIHPGYGFLSENADFAEAVMAAGLVWIGPPPAAIRAMGLKDAAKTLMIEAGVPVTPGYQGEDQSDATLTAEAARIGYPVLIKAVAGGGGKGMKRVDRPEDFAAGLASARREGQSSFGDPRVLIESYITRPRHIEVQIFGDSHGKVVHLYERDCSLQRRHQKVIEEAPAPGMDDATRKAVTDAAVRAARAVNYEGAGTIEFIADASDGLKADRIWFMEMNTRLQVEHPVTEEVTGVDLVEWQFLVAAGEPLPLEQDEISLNGWAMEARLYAEDPANGFLPSIGRLDHFLMPNPDNYRAPHDVRVDTGVEEGGEVSQFYDPMISKIIAHADTRTGAAERLAAACRQVEVWPVRTNAAFLSRCLEHPRFVAGDVDTGFIAAEEASLISTEIPEAVIAAAFAAQADKDDYYRTKMYGDGQEIWRSSSHALFGFRLNGPGYFRRSMSVAGQPVEAEFRAMDGDTWWEVKTGDRTWGAGAVAGGQVVLDDAITGEDASVEVDDELSVLFLDGQAWPYGPLTHGGGSDHSAASDGSLRAPMPGKIVATPARPGDTVTRGQPVVVLEAMKMEHALVAPFDGVVGEVGVAVGDQVSADTVVAVVTATD
ncbi:MULTISPECIES: acetyl/propionyl/methylcrotonyl-CoA carboxylase subunit alpha [unclassified Brevundimonas]|uniref:acetyl/propionyl/methylcrotonyl-CoA carboxylase subunit alpha n=1 Tax=unclassified Brevundimonas TaxID=2622653 RepID=UPI0006FCE1B8|nr:MULTISPECIES: acetyl/propionyl/methylcrotonyl-CoA carboxylase subunit alpha [unclassified Brevundimonas]KQY95675.1 methylcrotonoyl-CoA carboxylase [Brevundimonas sp. Root1423]KRA19677.1 methylcrotonoyl-CoA carboxylase [Brevundimonas sp. Root608]